MRGADSAADAVGATEDVAATVTAATLLANDTGPGGQALVLESVGAAVNGTVSLVGGDVSFVPDADFAGVASFGYTVRVLPKHPGLASAASLGLVANA